MSDPFEDKYIINTQIVTETAVWPLGPFCAEKGEILKKELNELPLDSNRHVM